MRRVLTGAAFACLVVIFPSTDRNTAAALENGQQRLVARWCGDRSRVDLACLLHPNVELRRPGDSQRMPLVGRTPRVLESGTTLTADAGAAVRVTFRKEALCAFGDPTGQTLIVTRWNNESRLFRQDRGQSLCTFARGAKRERLQLFCDVDPDCPVVVKTDGSSFQTHTSNPAIIDLCAGQISIVATTNGASTEVSSSAGGNAHHRAIIRWSENSISVDVVTVGSAGVCAGRALRQQVVEIRR